MEVTLSAFRKRFTYEPQKDLLGNGGFSQVYKAYDNEDKIFVALKIYQGDPVSKYNLINEVKRFKKLRHPNIVEHIEAYEVNTGAQDIHGNPVQYQVGILEYADGGTLADLLKKGKPDYRLLEDLAKDIIDGLAYLHTNNIIHRDLKPSNILLFNENGKLRAKITDFGIAKITDATAASTQLVGTVEYMAPEFFKTESAGITPASDLWSLGVILLEALTGIHPFGKTGTGSTSEQIIHNILFVNPAEAQNFTSLPEPFKSIITNCLRREPDFRPTSAADLKHYFDAKPQDVFGERTQLIETKFKKGTDSKQKTSSKKWGTAMLDFEMKNGKWKWVIAKELFVAIVGLILIGSSYLAETKRIEYLQDKYERKLHKELVKDFLKKDNDKWGDYITSFAPNGCKNSNDEFVSVDVKFEDFKSHLYKIGSDLAECLRGNSKYEAIMDEMPSESIFIKLTNFNNRPDEYSFYRHHSDSLEASFFLFFFLLYPFRLIVIIIFWVLKTLGFTFPPISKKTSKAIKYSLLLIFLLILFFIGYKETQNDKPKSKFDFSDSPITSDTAAVTVASSDTASVTTFIASDSELLFKSLEKPASKKKKSPIKPEQSQSFYPIPKVTESYANNSINNLVSYFYCVYDGYATDMFGKRQRWADVSKVHSAYDWDDAYASRLKRGINNKVNEHENSTYCYNLVFEVNVYHFETQREAQIAREETELDMYSNWQGIHQAFFAIDDWYAGRNSN